MENVENSNEKKSGQSSSGTSGGGAGYGSSKGVSGNPDVNFGADKSGSNDVEIDTAGLDNDKEVDLDRSGISTGHKDLEEKSEDDPAIFNKNSSRDTGGQVDASI